jgi:hypothetical protein
MWTDRVVAQLAGEQHGSRQPLTQPIRGGALGGVVVDVRVIGLSFAGHGTPLQSFSPGNCGLLHPIHELSFVELVILA